MDRYANGKVVRRPRDHDQLTQTEAYDELPKPVRDALKEGPQKWNTWEFLKWYRVCVQTQSERFAIETLVKHIWELHAEEIAGVPDSIHNKAHATMCLSEEPYRANPTRTARASRSAVASLARKRPKHGSRTRTLHEGVRVRRDSLRSL